MRKRKKAIQEINREYTASNRNDWKTGGGNGESNWWESEWDGGIKRQQRSEQYTHAHTQTAGVLQLTRQQYNANIGHCVCTHKYISRLRPRRIWWLHNAQASEPRVRACMYVCLYLRERRESIFCTKKEKTEQNWEKRNTRNWAVKSPWRIYGLTHGCIVRHTKKNPLNRSCQLIVEW